MKCQISWIDPNTGKATPDDNEAIGQVYREAYTSQSSQYLYGFAKFEKTANFPICAAHATRLTDLGMEHWVFVPFPMSE